VKALQTFLFWFTMLGGTAVLAPCLILPAWLDRQAQAAYLQAQQEYVAALRGRLEAVQRQVEHLNNDPAYVLRLAQQEFGPIFAVPNVETILVAPPETESAALADLSHEPPAPPELSLDPLPNLDQFVDEALRRYPHTQVFVDEHTRPTLLVVGGGLLLAGVVLFGLVGERARPAQPEGR
jgi:hypothetical protein